MIKILSFGEVLWDIFESEKHLGGAPLNFAAHSAALGAKTWLASAVGDDDLGKETAELVKKHGVGTEYVSVASGKETGKCLVSLDKNGVPSFDLLDDVAYDHISFPDLSETPDVIAFGTLALRHEGNIKILNRLLKSNDFPCVFSDVNIRAPYYSEKSVAFCLENSTIVKISDEELPIVSKLLLGDSFGPEQAPAKLSEKYPQLKIVIITKGAKGSCCYDCEEKKFYYADAEKTTVVSTVGAGDSFGAAFLVKYLEGNGCDDCLKFASKISAFVCSKAQAVPDNMARFLAEQQ